MSRLIAKGFNKTAGNGMPRASSYLVVQRTPQGIKARGIACVCGLPHLRQKCAERISIRLGRSLRRSLGEQAFEGGTGLVD